jgi:hypothetical protein
MMPGRLMLGLVRHTMDPRWQGAPRPARSAERAVRGVASVRLLKPGPSAGWRALAYAFSLAGNMPIDLLRLP